MDHSRKIKVLIVEDDTFTAMVYQDLLEEVTHIQFEITTCETLGEGLSALKDSSYNVLLLDLNLPDSDFHNTINAITGIADEIPIVVMTSTNDEKLALKAVNNGGQDYLVKDKLERQTLLRSILYAIERHQLKVELKRAKAVSDSLLKNILPEAIAEELKSKGRVEARYFEDVSVMFVDFSQFTKVSSQMDTSLLVAELHHCFSAFDKIAGRHGLEKIKTIGDSYMCAAGVPRPVENQHVQIASAAHAMMQFVAERRGLKAAEAKPFWNARIGIHTGPVVAGVVGIHKFTYDIWGNTVNVASRMEACGEEGRVNISHSLYTKLASDQHFTFTPRGAIEVKGKGSMEMYFVEPATRAVVPPLS